MTLAFNNLVNAFFLIPFIGWGPVAPGVCSAPWVVCLTFLVCDFFCDPLPAPPPAFSGVLRFPPLAAFCSIALFLGFSAAVYPPWPLSLLGGSRVLFRPPGRGVVVVVWFICWVWSVSDGCRHRMGACHSSLHASLLLGLQLAARCSRPSAAGFSAPPSWSCCSTRPCYVSFVPPLLSPAAVAAACTVSFSPVLSLSVFSFCFLLLLYGGLLFPPSRSHASHSTFSPVRSRLACGALVGVFRFSRAGRLWLGVFWPSCFTPPGFRAALLFGCCSLLRRPQLLVSKLFLTKAMWGLLGGGIVYYAFFPSLRELKPGV